MVRPNETRQYVHDPRRYQSRLRLPNGVQEVSVWQEPRAERGFFFAGRSARHRAALPVLSLRAFHHSTNIGSRIDLIDDLEVGENLPRRKLFDFLLVQTVEPIKERPLVRRQFRMLSRARHGEPPTPWHSRPAVQDGTRSTFIFAASLARSRPRPRRR